MRYKLAISADHGGVELKDALINSLSNDWEVTDLGAHKYDPDDDYPDFAVSIAHAVASGQMKRGILICGSGVGACIAANKIPGVRACVCHDTYSAHQGVEHDAMNILCLGARVIGVELAIELVKTFLNADFSAKARHLRRLEKVIAIEQQSQGKINPKSKR